MSLALSSMPGHLGLHTDLCRGDVSRTVIVRTCEKLARRPDGPIIRIDDSATVLPRIREILGTRIGGLVSANMRIKGWEKIALWQNPYQRFHLAKYCRLQVGSPLSLILYSLELYASRLDQTQLII
ncbi:hypothetical protein BDQ12DRAFT_773472 [Crucibulum laeve]|uniref:Uncharacterized protein n=1 Tax=Crucibulum laeve TaxID=68775 RepID=A0A5C3LH43_9AGAR|nr:hypothetical protein BDQ12DRAFT_773472 [Crucibulum laeve]